MLGEVPAAMQSACDAGNFFLVGEGWAFDSNQEEIRLGCKLPAVPTYTVSAAFAHGKDVYMGVPNPADETTSAFFAQMAKLFPEQVKHVATLTGAFSATQETRDRLVEVAPKFGWAFSESTLEHNPLGEADWTPFVKQIADSGAQILSWQGTCLPHLLNVAQAAKANGLNLIIAADSNHYARECADANTTGALDNMHIRMAFIPFEEASVNKATQDYLDLMKPRVMSLVVFTALVGMVVAPVHVNPVIGFFALVCIAVGAGAAGALNMWYDADIDARMSRTQGRPIPQGRVTADEALTFGIVLSVLSVMTIGTLVNWAAGALLALTIGLDRKSVV